MSRDIRIELDADELDWIKDWEIHYTSDKNCNIEIALSWAPVINKVKLLEEKIALINEHTKNLKQSDRIGSDEHYPLNAILQIIRQ